jgi:mono/diheme cytochrome c family protein
VPSQTKYIFEAALAILVATLCIKCINFFSSAELYNNPSSSVTGIEYAVKTATYSGSGRNLFMLNCASCHSINKTSTGPSLASIQTRVPDRKLIIAWIKNNREVLESGNVYFNNLYKEYNKIAMPIFTQLNEREIESILDYVTAPQRSQY